MIDISLGGLIGAIVGTIISAFAYGAMVDFLERRYLAMRAPADQDRATLREVLGLLRRAVLTVDLLAFCAFGYWLGQKVGG